MKIKGSIASSVVVAVVGLGLATSLIAARVIGELSFITMITVTALVGLAIFLSPRLKELDLKGLRLVLEEIAKVKKEVEEMYGGIENIKRGQMVMDDAKMEELGLPGGTIAKSSAVARYMTGCIKRERERLASIFIKDRPPEQIAEAILDGSKDDLVFKWNGPETPLNVPPKTVKQREAEAAAEAESQQKPSESRS